MKSMNSSVSRSWACPNLSVLMCLVLGSWGCNLSDVEDFSADVDVDRTLESFDEGPDILPDSTPNVETFDLDDFDDAEDDDRDSDELDNDEPDDALDADVPADHSELDADPDMTCASEELRCLPGNLAARCEEGQWSEIGPCPLGCDEEASRCNVASNVPADIFDAQAGDIQLSESQMWINTETGEVRGAALLRTGIGFDPETETTFQLLVEYLEKSPKGLCADTAQKRIDASGQLWIDDSTGLTWETMSVRRMDFQTAVDYWMTAPSTYVVYGGEKSGRFSRTLHGVRHRPRSVISHVSASPRPRSGRNGFWKKTSHQGGVE